MKKEKSKLVKERNREILSQLNSNKGDKFKETFQFLMDKYGMTKKRVQRVYSKMNVHPLKDSLGNEIGKGHWKVHTKSWWVN
jgi:hypothetical protein